MIDAIRSLPSLMFVGQASAWCQPFAGASAGLLATLPSILARCLLGRRFLHHLIDVAGCLGEISHAKPAYNCSRRKAFQRLSSLRLPSPRICASNQAASQQERGRWRTPYACCGIGMTRPLKVFPESKGHRTDANPARSRRVAGAIRLAAALCSRRGAAHGIERQEGRYRRMRNERTVPSLCDKAHAN